MKIKTQDLTGAALDWAVAMAEGYKPRVYSTQSIRAELPTGGVIAPFMPGFRWSQGGPIIELQGILFIGTGDGETYNAWICKPYAAGVGPTHLIAAMRCYVASKLGDEVDIPEELL